MWLCALWLACAGAGAAALSETETVTAAAAAAALRGCARGAFALESGVLAAEAGARAGGAGWLLRGGLRVRALWPPEPAAPDQPDQPDQPAADDLLLGFQLEGVTVLGRGSGARAEWRPRGSLWDEPQHSRAEFYAHWRRGAVLAAYLDRDDHPDVANYKRSLISLFQFQTADGERNETDISGECAVAYEALSADHLRKTKERCAWHGAGAPAGVTSRRVARYTLARARLAGVRAEEAHEFGAGGAAAAGLKARAWHVLTLQETEEAPPPPLPPPLMAAADLSAALATLPARFQRASLELPLPDEPQVDLDEREREAQAALSEWAAAEGAPREGEGEGEGGAGSSERAGGGGTARLALAALRLLHAAESSPQLFDRLLREDQDLLALAAGARVAGASGSALALRALERAAPLRLAPPPALAAAYLHAAAVAPAPHESVVQQLLSLGESDASGVGRAALLAGAAAAARLPHPAAQRARDRLAAALARCKDDECRARRVLALGNMRREDTAALLLEHAGGARAVALAALDALRGLPARALSPPRRARLLRLALGPPAGARPLEVRALALELAAARARDWPAQLAPAAHALRTARAADAELRRVLRGRVESLDMAEELGAAVQEAGWAAAAAGDSAVLARDAGWGRGGWRARLDSLQLAARGALRRGTVRLALLPPGAAHAQPEHDVLAVTLSARGLAALAGATSPAPAAPGDEHDDDDDEDFGGELDFELLGARLPTVTLFSSQAELVGHVWAGTGSTPLPALRALLAGPALAARVPLLAGTALSLRAAHAAHLALDAQMSVSLWARTARGGLRLRAGLAARAQAAARAAWGRLRVRARAASQPRLRLALDLDFYARAALCVRVSLDDHDYRRNATLESAVGARRWRVVRRRTHAAGGAGRTLALTRETHAACRRLAPASGDD